MAWNFKFQKSCFSLSEKLLTYLLLYNLALYIKKVHQLDIYIYIYIYIHSSKRLAYLLGYLCTNVYLMYLCGMAGVGWHITSTWFSDAQNSYYKLSGEFRRQDSQSSYSFGRIQVVGETELYEEKKFNVSLEKDFIFRLIYFFPLVLLLISSFQINNPELARWFWNIETLNSGANPPL